MLYSFNVQGAFMIKMNKKERIARLEHFLAVTNDRIDEIFQALDSKTKDRIREYRLIKNDKQRKTTE